MTASTKNKKKKPTQACRADIHKLYENSVQNVKGEIDFIASKKKIERVEGGNAGMTKGGTGDVLAGRLVRRPPRCVRRPEVARHGEARRGLPAETGRQGGRADPRPATGCP